MDKRIIKTRNAIKEAFMNIVLHKELNKITVSDIAEKALINRSTFYLHYTDASAVMSDIEREIADKIVSCLESFDTDDVYGSTYSLFYNLTSALNDMETIKKFILYSTSSKYIIEKIKDLFIEKAMQQFIGNDKKQNELIYYGITFLASGMIDTFIKWSYESEKALTLEELCKYVGELARLLSDNLRIENK